MSDLSVVVPCFNEEGNLQVLYDRICEIGTKENVSLELIFVDDHSRDGTFNVAAQLSKSDPRVRAIRLAKNSGSHIACICGLEHSTGDAAVLIAADLQDPPEVIAQLLANWRSGAQVVWATRAQHIGQGSLHRLLSGLFHRTMARVLNNDILTRNGADFFLADRLVVDALLRHPERNISVFATVAWLGFDQRAILYEKQERLSGGSGWTFWKKLKLFIDSVTGFSYFPIRLISVLGFAVACFGGLYSIVVLINYFTEGPIEGWTSIMMVLLVLGGLQIATLGIIGEYLWRTLDEARQRPRYNIEKSVGGADSRLQLPCSFEKQGKRHDD